MGRLYAGVALAFAGIFDLGLGLSSMTGLGLPIFVSTVSLPILSASAKVGSTASKTVVDASS